MAWLAEPSRRSEATDAFLVESVRRGDWRAFDALYARHASGVRAAVRSHVRDPDHADDVVQETFTRALESLSRLNAADSFRPWLLSIARHTAVDVQRGLARRMPEMLEAADALPSPDPTPAELAEIAELTTLVRDAIQGLSRRDATVLGMVGLGFGIPEIADAIGIAPGAAKVAVHRGRRRLRGAVLLQVLSRRQLPGCESLEAINPSLLIAVARHLDTCKECAGMLTDVSAWAPTG